MIKIPHDATRYRARWYLYITQRGEIKMFILYLQDEVINDIRILYLPIDERCIVLVTCDCNKIILEVVE